MIISIHQPNFLPWIGYFYKIYKSDVFVILDDVQYSKNSFTNRNRIKTSQGNQWITLPVIKSGNFGQLISECIIFNHEKTIQKLIKTIEQNYKKAPYYNKHSNTIKSILTSTGDNLCEINIKLIKYFVKELRIETKIICSSEFKISNECSTERLIQICQRLGGKTYLSGKGGDNYQDIEMYKNANIDLIYSDFSHPIYPQLWQGFIPGMSIIDLLFNCGEESKNLFK